MSSKAKKGSTEANVNFELTEAEWLIIKKVWENEPCAAPTVQEALQSQKRWSYSTVKTMMDRMADKGLLTTEKIRNLILYRSAVTQNQAQKSELLRTLKRAFNGALTPMMQFLVNNDDLSEKELLQLKTMLKAKRKKTV
ncbi:MAG: BlaI/MecI/CopY family transcriptional regulator [Phycisphaerae bacterium]